MKLIIKGEPKEIADLIFALQGQPMKKVKPPKIKTIVTLDGKVID